MKEKYIIMRNTQKYDLQWFYNYWNDKKGGKLSINDFGQIFNMQNLDMVLEFLDHKFNLTTLHNRDGSFIKCYS
jgi:hypothetical protein